MSTPVHSPQHSPKTERQTTSPVSPRAMSPKDNSRNESTLEKADLTQSIIMEKITVASTQSAATVEQSMENPQETRARRNTPMPDEARSPDGTRRSDSIDQKTTLLEGNAVKPLPNPNPRDARKLKGKANTQPKVVTIKLSDYPKTEQPVVAPKEQTKAEGLPIPKGLERFQELANSQSTKEESKVEEPVEAPKEEPKAEEPEVAPRKESKEEQPLVAPKAVSEGKLEIPRVLEDTREPPTPMPSDSEMPGLESPPARERNPRNVERPMELPAPVDVVGSLEDEVEPEITVERGRRRRAAPEASHSRGRRLAELSAWLVGTITAALGTAAVIIYAPQIKHFFVKTLPNWFRTVLQKFKLTH